MDKIANFITALKNASIVRKEKVFFPYSKMIENIATVLKNEGYIKTIKNIDSKNGNPSGKFLEVILEYGADKNPKIREVVRVSKSSRRVYEKSSKLPVFKRGVGCIVMTTPKGIMTAKNAKKENVGGEILFKIF